MDDRALAMPQRHRARVLSLALAAALLAVTPASRGAEWRGPDDVAVTAGYGNQVAVYGLAASWNSLCDWRWFADHGIDTRLVAEIAYWQPRDLPSPNPMIWDASLTPTLRWSARGDATGHAYVDLGVGAHLLSATRINTGRDFGQTFQLGEQLGAGYVFAGTRRFEVGVLLAHVSNATMNTQNWGLTYGAVVFRVGLD